MPTEKEGNERLTVYIRGIKTEYIQKQSISNTTENRVAASIHSRKQSTTAASFTKTEYFSKTAEEASRTP
jgi:hypothetical protein